MPSLLIGSAKWRFNTNRPELALHDLEEILSTYPKSDFAAEALYLRGVCRYKTTHDPKPLKEAYEILYARDALLKHLIVLSDGQSAAADFGGLIRRMTKDKITVSTVAIGRDADVRLMRDISRWGRGRFYFTEDPQSIPRIFTLEAQLASKSAIIERPFRPVLTHTHHEILRNIDWREVPPLGGYVATTPKATGEVLLASPQGDPVLGTLWPRKAGLHGGHIELQGRGEDRILRFPRAKQAYRLGVSFHQVHEIRVAARQAKVG